MKKGDNALNRGSRWFYFACLAVIAAVLAYAMVSRSDAPDIDRNVPGATTGPGKTSLTD